MVDNAPKRIKFLQFGILSPQEIVAISEFEANHRDLYKLDEKNPGQRLQAPNGVLDARLVGLCESTSHNPTEETYAGHVRQVRLLRDMRA